MNPWLELLGYAFAFFAIVGLAVHKARELRHAAGKGGQGTSERLSDVGAGIGLGTSAFGALMLSLAVGVLIAAVVIGGIALVDHVVITMNGKRDQVLLAIFSAPLVISGIYLFWLTQRWSFRKIDALLPNRNISGQP